MLINLQLLCKIQSMAVQQKQYNSSHGPPTFRNNIKKALHKAPARLQDMIMRMQRYTVAIRNKKLTSLLIADTLSRASLPDPVDADATRYDFLQN